MNRILWPDWYFDDVSHIPDNFFASNNIRFLLCDIDNTLAPYSAATPPAAAKAKTRAKIKPENRFMGVSPLENAEKDAGKRRDGRSFADVVDGRAAFVEQGIDLVVEAVVG